MYLNAKNLELKFTSTGNQNITGVRGGVRNGTTGADLFNSLSGETLVGGLGDDVYNLWDNTSKILEKAGEGNDTAYVRYWGGYKLADNVENAVIANEGGNWLTGNASDNLLVAGATHATLDGGAGNDVLVGGAGADIFKISAGNGSDAIYNFKPGWDAVSLNGYNFSTYDQLKAAASQVGADVSIKLSSAESLLLRGVQLSSLSAADFGLPMTKAIAPAGSTILTGSAAYNYNGWYAFNNPWGTSGLKAGKDYSLEGFFNKADMTKGTTFSWSFPLNTDLGTAIKAYPEVIFGISPLNPVRSNPTDTKMVLPVKVADLVSFTAKYDVSFSGNTGGFNVSYDIWLTNKPYGDASTITNEVMVWVHKPDFAAFGKQVGTYTDASGNTAKIYHDKTYTAVVFDKDIPKGTIDVTSILAKLTTLGYVHETDYVASIELGSEVVSGAGSLTINDLDLRVESKAADGATVVKMVGGDGTTVTTIPASKPAPAEPVTSTPAPSTPETAPSTSIPSSPNTSTPVTSTPVTSTPVTSTPVTSTPVTSTPVTQTPSTPPPVTSTPSTPAPSAPAVNLLKSHYENGSKTLLDSATGAKLGVAETVVTEDKVTITKTDKVGKSLGVDVARLDGSRVSVEHFNGAGKLQTVDKVTYEANGGVTTKHYTADGVLIGSDKQSTAANGAVTTQYFNASGALTGSEKVSISASGVTTTAHYDAKSVLTGSETLTINTDGSSIVRHLDISGTVTSVDVIKTIGSNTTVFHYTPANVLTGAEVSSLDSNGAERILVYDAAWKMVEAHYEGSDRADNLTGLGVETHFHGGLGSDILTGSSGTDYFHFDTAIGQGDVDTINKFVVKQDKIALDHSIFTELKVGALNPDAFVAGAKAVGAGDHIMFDKSSGELWYDDDGIGAHAPILLAKLTGGVALTAGDFIVT